MFDLLKLTDDQKKKILNWLDNEIRSALDGRSDLEDKWEKQLKMFEARPDQEIKNFPFEKASNLVVPMLSITVNAYVARQINSLFQYRPFWTVTPLSSRWEDHAVPTQRLLDYAQWFEMKLIKRMIPWLYDLAIHGTAVAKIPWVHETLVDKMYDENGKIVANEMEVSNGPRFIPIPLNDFIMPIQSFPDIQKMPWIAHRFRLRWPQIVLREKNGYYKDTEKIERFINDQVDKISEERERLQRISRMKEVNEYEFFEVWCDHDYDDDGIIEKVCYTIHLDSGTIVRATLNPWSHRLRPFILAHCFERPHSIYGIGFGQKLERLQDGVTTTVNQAIDNATIANTRLFKVRKGSGLKPPFRIYAGKTVFVNDDSDITAMPMGDIYPSIGVITGMLQQFSERETGVSDYNLGKESPIVGSGATATSTLALIQEGSKLFDFLLKNIRFELNEVAYQTYSLYSQFKPSGLTFSLLDKDGSFVEETWQAGPQDVRRSLLFEITASSSTSNMVLERESWMNLMNLIMGYYQKIFDASVTLVDPKAPAELKELISKMIVSGTKIMDKIVERWGILDKSRILLNEEDIAQLTAKSEANAQQMMAGMMPGGQNAGGPPINGGAGSVLQGIIGASGIPNIPGPAQGPPG